MNNEQLKFTMYQVRHSYIKLLQRVTDNAYVPCKYAGKGILDVNAGNNYILKSLESEKPFLVSRFGYNELQLYIDASVKHKIEKKTLDRMCNFAGFFPNDSIIAEKFGNVMVDAFKQVDLCGLFFSPGEEYVLDRFCKESKIASNRAIEPWYTPDNPWSKHLRGKRVLVIHPFEGTIISQFKNREKIFPGTEIIPEFELLTVKAVQTIAGETDERFDTWFEALDYMAIEASRLDFDVALIGCGAYGLPLAARIKAMGKQAIHIGGALQIMFGIKGKRWDNHPIISRFYNEDWVRPSEEEVPEAAKTVEGGCYW